MELAGFDFYAHDGVAEELATCGAALELSLVLIVSPPRIALAFFVGRHVQRIG